MKTSSSPVGPLMFVNPETQVFLDAVEGFAGRKFKYRTEVGTLFDLAESQSMSQLFQEITFHAKFAWHARTILKRTGFTSDETAKLSFEFHQSLDKAATLVRTLIEKAPDDFRRNFDKTFLALSHESLNNFIGLLHDLSWVKNYELDTKHPS